MCSLCSCVRCCVFDFPAYATDSCCLYCPECCNWLVISLIHGLLYRTYENEERIKKKTILQYQQHHPTFTLFIFLPTPNPFCKIELKAPHTHRQLRPVTIVLHTEARLKTADSERCSYQKNKQKGIRLYLLVLIYSIYEWNTFLMRSNDTVIWNLFAASSSKTYQEMTLPQGTKIHKSGQV